MGFDYRVDPYRSVEGELTVHLARDKARAFGKQANMVVAEAGGDLVRSSFEGVELQSDIDAAQTAQAGATEEIARIETQLANAASMSEEEAAALRRRISELRDRDAAAQQEQSRKTGRLAMTPMTFAYYGDVGVPGFRGENPFRNAWETFVATVVTIVTFSLNLIAVLLPLGLLAALLLTLWRSRLGRRIRGWVGWRAAVQD